MMRPFARLAALVAAVMLFPGGLAGCKPASSSDASDPARSAAPHVAATDAVAAGRYIVAIAGCNDCHTPGYMEADGAIPESEWLTGSPVGWRGPWGTTYPSNLRLLVRELPEDAFVGMLRTRKALPPMPWPSVNHLSEADARALYRFIHSLGPTGTPMPAIVPPDVEPTTPYFDAMPQHLERLATLAPAAEPGM